jgi:phosphoserine phosphatase
MAIKILFTDMEGTVFKKDVRIDRGVVAPSLWAGIARVLAESEEGKRVAAASGETAWDVEKRLQDAWKARGFSKYVEFVDDTVRQIHIPYGLRQELFAALVDGVEYQDGVHDAFEWLRDAGMMSAMVTGGFWEQARRAQRDLGLRHVAASCEYHWGDDGRIIGWNSLPYDEIGKVNFMRDIIREHGLDPKECAFIGDGKNDRHLAREVGLAIGITPQSELIPACHAVIAEPDYHPVIEILRTYDGSIESIPERWRNKEHAPT